MNRGAHRLPLWTSLSALLCLAFLFGPAAAQDAKKQDAKQKPGYAKGVTIEGITEYRLPNGLKFLLFPDPSSSNVTVNMTVLVGSRHEGYGETGMAHLLEHMLFKGSKNFPHIDKAMQAHGADYNGTTWLDRTNYYETMAANNANLEFGIKLEADRLVNSFVKREDLVKEMTVVRNEFEMGENSPENILNQRINAAAFEWHNYGKSTIGNRADIERVPIERLQAFYKKYYQPDNAVVVVAGRFDEAKAAELIAKHFGAIPAPKRKLEQTYTEEPAQDGERNVILRRVGKVPVVGSAYHIPAAAHDDHPPLEVLSTILGDTPSGRLYKELVEKKKATSVSAYVLPLHDPGLLETSAKVADQVTPEEVRDITIKVLEEFPSKPATKEEVERAVRRYLSDREQAMTKSKKIALELSEWIGAGDWRLLFVYRDRVAKVTPEEVNRVADKYLKQTNRTVGIYYPTDKPVRTPVPDTPDVQKIVASYKGGKALASGEVFDPSPKNIEERVQRFTLSNGVKVAVLPKKTRGESVVGRLAIHFGNEKSLQGKTTAADFLGALMLRGTKQYTRQQIEDQLDKLKSSLSVSSDAGTLTASWQSKREQLPRVLELLREVLREPTFPADEFEILKRGQKQALEKGLTDPQALAINALRRQLRPFDKNDVRYVPTIPEQLERLDKLSRDDVAKLYQQQLGANVAEVTLVGDFDVEATKKELEKIFADWKTDVAYERIKEKVPTVVKGSRQSILTPDKENAIYIAGLMFPMRDTDPDYPAFAVGNYVLGSGGFTSRLMERLRQKEGWSYGAGSQVRVGSQDKVGVFTAYAISNPTVIDKVDQGVKEEIEKILKEGVSQEELDAAKKGYLQEMKVARGNDANLAGILRTNLHLGRTFDYYADLEQRIANLSVKDVNQALTRHLDQGRLAIVRAGDLNKKAPAAQP